MTKEEWKKKYEVSDEDFSRIDMVVKLFGGTIVAVVNTPKDFVKGY